MRHEQNGRRLGVRTPTSMRARLFDDSGASTSALMRDLSTRGARLVVGPDARVPRRFVIRFGEYEAHAEIVWRNGGEVGIRFVLAEDEIGRVRPPRPIVAPKTPLADLRNAVRPRRRLFGLLPG